MRESASRNGAIAVIAPGTGLGESFLTWNGSQYVAHSSEGGHSDFAPTDERQIRLLRYCCASFDHVGVERVCSGIGIPNIYDYVREEEGIPESPDVTLDPFGQGSNEGDRRRGARSGSSERGVPGHDRDVRLDSRGLKRAIWRSKCCRPAESTSPAASRFICCPRCRRRDSWRSSHARAASGTMMERLPVRVITTRAALLGAATYGLETLLASMTARKIKEVRP